jgi:hypothetical protein
VRAVHPEQAGVAAADGGERSSDLGAASAELGRELPAGRFPRGARSAAGGLALRRWQQQRQ